MKVRSAFRYKGTKEYTCMPLVENLSKIILPKDMAVRHPNWRVVLCPVCKAECYEDESAKEQFEKGRSIICTRCAVKSAKLDYIKEKAANPHRYK